ncbi:hypothetical protein V5799_021984 [Amblyomma americanum]|uniref:ABC transporter domain-containing protein n=1 Tax=Amblyomma americanum TaxID=6943 RepID=A0AAQ4FM03_AMBAM
MDGISIKKQLCLVAWRQVWLLRIRRHYLNTLLEVACMLLVLSSVWEESVTPFRARPNKDKFFDSASAIQYWGRPNESWSHGSFAFAPSEPFFTELVARVCKQLGSGWKPVPFKDVEAAAQFVDVSAAQPATRARTGGEQLQQEPPVVHRRVAVWFARGVAERLTYHVRFHNATFDMERGYLRSLLVPGPVDTDRFDEMRLLLPLQYLVESTFIEMLGDAAGKTISMKVELIRFPYPKLFYGAEERTLSRVVLRFGIGFFVPFCVLVVKLVQEKRAGTKEMLRRVGLNDLAYWSGHFFEALFVVCCAILLMYVPIFEYRNVHGTAFLEHVDRGLFMVVLLLFGVLTILHAMLLSVFLWGPGVAFVAAVAYWFVLSLFPYALMQNLFGLGYYLTSRNSKLYSVISPVMYLHWCFRVIERFEKYHVRLTWKRFFDSATTLDNVSIGELIIATLSIAPVMAILIVYLDNVVPWGYGIPKTVPFIFSAEYWLPYRKWNIRNVAPSVDAKFCEHEPKSGHPVAHLINLCATGNDGSSVQNFSLTIYSKQITVILGPPGCGYSTILDVITGALLPTSGEVFVSNYDATDMSGRSWEYMSICPHESELFEELTMEEHLLFFSFLRQVPWSEAEQFSNVLLRQLNIEQHKDTLVSALSPRLQRALCVAITICGAQQSPLLIFQEPTKLMDPKCRHEVWEALARSSYHSSVLVTTQSIEEAEVLADRLIVMREGRIMCAGSPTWLKKRMGSGFFLRLTKLADFRENEVKKVVQYHMGPIEPKRVTKLETIFNLSDSMQHTSHVASMLQYLDKKRTVLGIAFMSLTSCTLEDVYINMVTSPEQKTIVGGGDTRILVPAEPNVGALKGYQELDAMKQLCTARSGKAGSFAVLDALLRKRFYIWARIWWIKPLTVGIPLASMLLLGLCERHFMPDLAPAAANFTYTSSELLDDPYGFIESDDASMKFSKHVLLPVMSEHSSRISTPKTRYVERELLFWAQRNIYEYIVKYQYGVSLLTGKRAYIWFNGQCPYSAVLAVNMFHTALLRNLTGKNTSDIILVNSPYVEENRIPKIEFERRHGKLVFEPGHRQLGHEIELFTTRNLITRVFYSFFVSLAMSSYAASHVLAPMGEWSSGLKHLQLMTGMTGLLYWIGHFIFDMFMAVWNSLLMTFTIFINHMDITLRYHLAILVLFIANAFSSLPLAYLFSGLSRNTTRAFSFMALGLFLAGMVGSLGVEILFVLVQRSPSMAAKIFLFLWRFLCRWFPTYALVRGIIKVILLYRFNAICLTGGELLEEACHDPRFSVDVRTSRCCEALEQNRTARLLYPLEPFSETGFYEAVSMVVVGMLYLAVLALLDSPLAFCLHWYAARRLLGGDEPGEDAEEQRGPRLVALSMDPEVEREVRLVNQVCRTKAFREVAMVIRNVQKAVGFVKPVKILDGVNIVLNRSECFGLVCINNSGKSTLLDILVGLKVPTGGGAHMAALSLVPDLRAWQLGIGYAPDGISAQSMPALTVGELLDLMARLRGVSLRRQAVQGALALAGRLKEDRMINKCNHGEMKKLLIAAAVIGVPPVLLVDEPYSDVEPLYRNEILRMLQVLKGAQAMSIIMTSHRMSHCEVLCDRVAVIETGKIEALGEPLQMNQKYGRSYIVTLRLPPERRFDYQFQRMLVDAMQEEFHQCNFCHNYKGLMMLSVGKTYTSWGELFTKLCNIKRSKVLPEMSLCDITLEHIFVGLARRQILYSGERANNYLTVVPSRVDNPTTIRSMVPQ